MAFGPGSLLYESYGDRVGYLCAPATGLLQLMYPPLGRGVEQHSEFYDEPFERLLRSVPQIVGIIFDGDRSLGQAHRVRDFHADIKGTMADGSRYHALDPETFFWAHATFIDVIFRVDDLFHKKPLDPDQRAAYYAECVEWWRMYGMTMRVVPPTYPEFLAYWQHQVDEVLELTPAAARFVEFLHHPWEMEQPWLPRPAWRVLSRIGGIPARDMAVGAMPERVRELCGFSWTSAQQLAFDGFRRVVAHTWPLVPESLRLGPRPRAAYRRQGRLGLDAALARVASGTGYVDPQEPSRTR
ncbi:oxygenase MpaB family protein [Nocardioides limicola]|uniref:oxygenase MpaB family protein n=1 Tax=Nocardioides limicola TaxID=2803368 RepID=UPI00193B5C36|nr:oxygenase MpaB family protein [Nocardioides sp. DJM-14]